MSSQILRQIFLGINIDDNLISGPNIKTLNELEEILHSIFECTSLEAAQYILGIQVDITN